MRNFDEARTRDVLQTINRQSIWLTNMINELLDLARIEARRGADFKFQRVCVQQLLADMLKAYKAPESRAQPELLLPQTLSFVRADQGKLRQAILNVIVNAYKFSPAGGAVSVQVTHSDAAAARICIAVSDNGIGMTPAQVAKVCTRFYRADASGSVPGTGLGMSIVKEIIELHGGELTIESAVGRGTTVSICLPVLMNPTQRCPLHPRPCRQMIMDPLYSAKIAAPCREGCRNIALSTDACCLYALASLMP